MDHLPEQIREQLEAQKEQCVFCRILSGEIEAKEVYADDLVEILLDINPAVKGHALLLPEEHYPILPLISPSEFDRLFGLMPQFADAIVEAMIADGLTVFMANGAAAGQQTPHFLMHLLPRERGDGLDQFDFSKRTVDEKESETVDGTVKEILGLMLAKHLGFEPVDDSGYLRGREIAVERSPSEQVAGHLEIRPIDDRPLTKLTFAESVAIFKAASLASTALFENLGCDATNIIADARDGLVIHVIPRRADDGLELLWSPMTSPPDPGEVTGKLSKKLFDVQVRVEKDQLDLPGSGASELERMASGSEPSSPPAPTAAPRAEPQQEAPSSDPADVRARIDQAWERLKSKQI